MEALVRVKATSERTYDIQVGEVDKKRGVIIWRKAYCVGADAPDIEPLADFSERGVTYKAFPWSRPKKMAEKDSLGYLRGWFSLFPRA